MIVQQPDVEARETGLSDGEWENIDIEKTWQRASTRNESQINLLHLNITDLFSKGFLLCIFWKSSRCTS